MQRRRGPKIVQYTDGQDQVIEQRTWFSLPLKYIPWYTACRRLRVVRGPNKVRTKNVLYAQLHALTPVEPQNPSLYQFQVFFPKRISSSEGVK